MSNKSLTYEQQIQKLKLKGMNIKDEDRIIYLLSNFNYTLVISPLKEIWARVRNLDINVKNNEFNIPKIEEVIKSCFIRDKNNSHIYIKSNFDDDFVYTFWNHQENEINNIFNKLKNFERKLKTKIAYFISRLIDELNLDQENWKDFLLGILYDTKSCEKNEEWIDEIKNKKQDESNFYSNKYIWFEINKFSFSKIIKLCKFILKINEIKVNKKIINFKEYNDKKINFLKDFMSLEYIKKENIENIIKYFIINLFFLKDIRNSVCHGETLQIFFIKKRILLIDWHINNKKESKRLRKIEFRTKRNLYNDIFPFNYKISTKLIYEDRSFVSIEDKILKTYLHSMNLLKDKK